MLTESNNRKHETFYKKRQAFDHFRLWKWILKNIASFSVRKKFILKKTPQKRRKTILFFIHHAFFFVKNMFFPHIFCGVFWGYFHATQKVEFCINNFPQSRHVLFLYHTQNSKCIQSVKVYKRFSGQINWEFLVKNWNNEFLSKFIGKPSFPLPKRYTRMNFSWCNMTLC